MRSGYWIVAIFAAGWGCGGLSAAGFPPGALALPVAVSAALLLWAYTIPATARDIGRQARKLILRWSLIEVAGIVAASSLIHGPERTGELFAAVAMIVGLHFLPLARGIPVRIYYLTGAALIALGAGAMLLPASERPLAVGAGAAAILWATAVFRLLGAQRGSVARA
ncbi:MAG: hypothetical protein ACTHMG_13500 [Sphingomonas sp.]